MRARRVVLAMLTLAGGVHAAGRVPTDPVQVHYPRGDCETGVLEIEVFSRSLQRWAPHPQHWRVLADTCQQEDAGELLNELRVRCVDLRNPGRASAWQTGVQVYQPAEAPGCVVPQHEEAPRVDPHILLTTPDANSPVQNLTKSTPLGGRVTLDHELGLLVDTRVLGAERVSVDRALEAWLEAVAPLLGALRVSVIPFAGADAAPADPGSAAVPPLEMKSDRAALGRALAEVWSEPPIAGATTALEAFLDLQEEGEGRRPLSVGLVVIVGGRGDFPFGRGASADPYHRSALLDAVDRALTMGVRLRIFVVGREEPVLAELVDRVREHIARKPDLGGLHVLADPTALDAALQQEMPIELRELRIVNLANGVLAEPLSFERSGEFTGEVVLETGRNQLRVVAILSDGRELVADFDRRFDAAMLRDHLRAAEAERIRRIRERDGVVEVEVEEP